MKPETHQSDIPPLPAPVLKDKQSVPRIFIVAGPSATGKSTAAKAIAERYGLPMVEGDDWHPKKNVEKMSQGEPLTDDDRWGWLQSICTASLAAALPAKFPPSELDSIDSHPPGCITTCSALKKSYRDLIRDHLTVTGIAVLRFVFLTASEEVLLKRIAERKDHYMKSNMVHSQVVTSEVPCTREEGDEGDEGETETDCTVIWTDDLNPDEVVDMCIDVVGKMMVQDSKEAADHSLLNGENVEDVESQTENGVEDEV